MHCFYCEPSEVGQKEIRLTGTDVNHIKNVLRMKTGEELMICDGEGTEYRCALLTLDKDEIHAEIREKRPSTTELPVRLVLYQGLPKKDKMELIVQKGVELGAEEIVPVAMKHCVVRLEEEKKEQKKRERWQAIAEGAAKQSGRGRVPVVSGVMNYEEAVRRAAEEGMLLLPYENARGMQSLRQAVTELTERLKDKEAKRPVVSVLIGPEGGFAPEEVAEAVRQGAVPVSLGRRILRTETAGLAMLSILMYEMECSEEGE